MSADDAIEMSSTARDGPPASDGGPPERRSRLYRARAIVLRRWDLGETDRILSVFSAEHGKRRVVAKGARRPGNRLAGHLEPFTVTRLLMARARSLDIVSQAESIDGFPRLRQSESAIATAAYFSELVDVLLPEDQGNDAVFELLYVALRLLDEGQDSKLVTLVFEMGLLRHTGYRPELRRCLGCDSEMEPVENGFSPEGGVVCPTCLRLRPDALPLSVNALKLLRAIDRGDIERLSGLRVPPEIWADLSTLLARYISRITGRESSARRVIGELRLQ